MSRLIDIFFISFGFVLGGSLLAGISSVLTLESPITNMRSVADNIKIWAMLAALGGSIDPIRIIETNLSDGKLSPAIEQMIFILSAFIGAHMGKALIDWICKGGTSF